ncbi:MAG: hypothetical protein MI864_27675 [Pseudomonadales bacterium]|nr:hypothetical protein [Pseudomonadales bacterium]
MTTVYENECAAAELDKNEVARIAKGLSRYAKQAQKLGIKVFGGSGTEDLRFNDNSGLSQLIVAELEGKFDGGDGSHSQDSDGLQIFRMSGKIRLLGVLYAGRSCQL